MTENFRAITIRKDNGRGWKSYEREKLQRFMLGRYGADELGRMLNIVALVCIVLSMFFTRIPVLNMLLSWGGLGLAVYTCFRLFSKNVAKRYEENQHYRTFRYQMVTKWDAKKKQFAQRKDLSVL